MSLSGLLFPACAGVIRGQVILQLAGLTFPRVCGGDPIAQEYDSIPRSFSPRVRG